MNVIIVTVSDAGSLMDVVPFMEHEDAQLFFEAMIAEGWDADLTETGVVPKGGAQEVIDVWNMED